MTLTPIQNLFLAMDKDVNYHRNRIAAIQLDKSRIFRKEFDAKPGSLRQKAKRMKVSPGYLCDACNGKRAITTRLVVGLSKL
jgi:hypothetical protein